MKDKTKVSAKRNSQATFLAQAKAKHGDKYDYTDAIYRGGSAKVDVRCPTHGVFSPRANNHVRGSGCPECRYHPTSTRWSKNNIVTRFKAVHGDTYDYQKVTDQLKITDKVIITCRKHGDFPQSIASHTSAQAGCPTCGREALKGRPRLSFKDWAERCKKMHNNAYDYSELAYESQYSTRKMQIYCKEHKMFFPQSAISHMNGSGCPFCGRSTAALNRISGTIHFIEKAKEVHGEKYDYSKVKYLGISEKVEIICKHGSFWQTPANHYRGYNPCAKCSQDQIKKQKVQTP